MAKGLDNRSLAMLIFLQSDDHKPRTWMIVKLIGKKERRSVSFTCPKGHTYLLDKYKIQPNGIVLPMVLCPADGCNFHEFIKLEGWVPQ